MILSIVEAILSVAMAMVFSIARAILSFVWSCAGWIVSSITGTIVSFSVAFPVSSLIIVFLFCSCANSRAKQSSSSSSSSSHSYSSSSSSHSYSQPHSLYSPLEVSIASGYDLAKKNKKKKQKHKQGNKTSKKKQKHKKGKKEKKHYHSDPDLHATFSNRGKGKKRSLSDKYENYQAPSPKKKKALCSTKGVWFWQADDGSFQPYRSEESQYIERQFHMGENLFLIHHGQHLIFFTDHTCGIQKNLDTNSQRLIKREEHPIERGGREAGTLFRAAIDRCCDSEKLRPHLENIKHAAEESLDYARNHREHKSKKKVKLDIDEIAALYMYTMDTQLYRSMNELLRGDIPNHHQERPFKDYLAILNSALMKLQNNKKVVWRGVPLYLADKHEQGEIILERGPLSASLSMGKAVNFMNRSHGVRDTDATLFQIGGGFGKKIENYSAFPDEVEVLFPCGSKFKVEEIARPTENRTIITLTQLKP